MRLLARIDTIGQAADLPSIERMPMRLVVWMGVLMSVGGVVWTGLALAAGHYAAALVPASYVVATSVNLTVFDRTGAFERTRRVQVALSLVLPFVFQLALGGIVASGAVMLWSLLALVASLAFQSSERSATTIGAFCALTCVVGALDAASVHWSGSPPSIGVLPTLYMLINVVMVGSIVGALAVFLDHLRRRHAHELQKANLENHALNDALRGQVLRAEEAERAAHAANRAKSTFLANMSHELRTPLNAIIGYAELLEEEEDQQVQHDAIRIRTAGRNLLSLVNDVLDVAKVEAGHLDLEQVPVDPKALAADLEHTLAPLFAERGNHLTVRADRVHSVLTDALRLRQILTNLLSNANKFTDHGRVQLTLWHRRDHLHIEVLDTGIGMSAEELSRVRQPFQQADSSTTRTYGGTGLGLHLVDRLTEVMGGSLHIASAKGHGTRVTATLLAPRAEEPAAGGERPTTPVSLHPISAEDVVGA